MGVHIDGQPAGSFSDLGVFSFNGNKIISTGGGGVIVDADEVLAKAAKHLSTQAKPDPMEYYHDAIGYNYRLVNVLAAIGVAQMEQLPGILARKRAMDAFYRPSSRRRRPHLSGGAAGLRPELLALHDVHVRMRPLLEYLNAQAYSRARSGYR